MNSSISYTHSDFLLELSEFSSSRNSQVPKTLKFQITSEFQRTEFHHSELQFHITSVFHRIEFHPFELEFQNTSEFQRTEFHHSELQFQFTSVLYPLEFHLSELEFQKYFSSYTHFLGSTTIRVPRNSTEFRHLITE